MLTSNLMKATLALTLTFSVLACSKSDDNGVDPSKPPVDPEIAPTIGFFSDEFLNKSFQVPANTTPKAPTTDKPTVTVTVDPYKIISRVPAYIFSENANVSSTQFVNQPTLISNINKLNPTVIRYPGGAESNIFFWDRDQGSLPADVPSTLYDRNGSAITPNWKFGKSTATETLSLDNYYQLLSQTTSKGMITVNYSYARYGLSDNPVAQAAKYAADWVRYDNGRTKYWEIGNENYGYWQYGYKINTAGNKDGQPEIIDGNTYADHASIIIDSMRKAAQEINKTIQIGAVLVEGEYVDFTNVQRQWNVQVIKKINSKIDFYSCHNYYTPFNTNSSADDILYVVPYSTDVFSKYIASSFKSAGAPVKPVALTEYNINAVGSSQAASYINGLASILVQGELLKNKFGFAARYSLTDKWNNGNSKGMFNTGSLPGGVENWSPSPVYTYQEMFKKFLGDRFITTTKKYNAQGNDIEAYASSFSNGYIGVVLVNKLLGNAVTKIDLKYWTPTDDFMWYELVGGTNNGSFSSQVYVNGAGPASATAIGGPGNLDNIPAYSTPSAGGITVRMAPRSAVFLSFKYKTP